MSEQPKNGRGLTKTISEYLGIQSSQMSQIMSGDRDFTEEQALSLTRFMGLRPFETEYFLNLVRFERAGTQDLKNYYKTNLQKMKTSASDLKQRLNPDRVLTDTEKAVFYSSYLYSAIRLTTTIGKGQTLGGLAERYGLPVEKTAEILSFLVDCGLCQEKDGLYALGSQQTHVGRESPFMARHSHNWRVKALDKTHQLKAEELQFTCPISLDEKTFHKIRELLVQSINQSIDHVKASEPTGVACLLVDLFWV